MITINGIEFHSARIGRKVTYSSIFMVALIFGSILLWGINALSTIGFILIFYFFGIFFLWSISIIHYKRFIVVFGLAVRGVVVRERDLFLIYNYYQNQGLKHHQIRKKIYNNLHKIKKIIEAIESIENQNNLIKLASVPIPEQVETLHFAITASTGAGKSVALKGLLKDIQKRGDRAIVLDNSGEFSKQFAKNDDLVLSPFDERSQGWDIKNEVKQPYEWLTLSRSIIPDGYGNDKSWNEMAQKLISNIGLNANPDNKTLLEIATNYSAEALKPIIDGTSSAVLLHDGGERLLTNIRSVYATHLQSWQFMKSGKFSLRDYIQSQDNRWLWMPFKESELGVTRDLIATWLDILVSSGLERAENEQKTWIIIDELDTLGNMPSLIDATTKLRKRNIIIVVAFQSYSQLVETYGKENTETLFNCFSNKLILRTANGVTAEVLSQELGDAEVYKSSHSQKGGATFSPQIERALLPSEIQSLPDLCGFLKIAGSNVIIKTKVSTKDAGLS